MHRLDRIQIAGFKSIRDQSLELRNLNVLIGANGAGKSQVLHAIALLHDLEIYHFYDTSTSAPVRQTGDIADNLALRPDARNLAAILYRIQEVAPGTFRNIMDIVRLMAPFFGGCDLQPDRLDPKKIWLEWHEKNADTKLDVSALSDGTLRFLCLATLLLQPQLPAVILIDEPELGLHPHSITVLAGLLRSAAVRAQVVIATQSISLINQFSIEDVIVVDREDGASTFRRLSSADLANWLDGYALGELWEKNVIGGRVAFSQ